MIEQPREQVPQPAAAKPKAAPKPEPPRPVPAPPGNPLTAEAGPGKNAYGLAVGNGSGDTIGGGGGDGGGGSRFGLYAGLVQSQIHAALLRDDKAGRGRYRVVVRLWLNANGQVTRAQLANSSGDAAMDNSIQRVLTGLTFGQAPPQDMPQPISIRIAAQAG